MHPSHHVEAHVWEEQGVSSFLIIEFLKVMLGKNLVSQIEALKILKAIMMKMNLIFFIMVVIIGVKRIIRMIWMIWMVVKVIWMTAGYQLSESLVKEDSIMPGCSV